MAALVLLSLFYIWSGMGWAWRLPSFCHFFYMVEDGRGMAAPALLSLFLYGRGRKGHAAPVLLSLFYMVEDGRGMAAPVLLSLHFIWSRTGGAWRLPSFCHCFLYSRGRKGHGGSRPSVIVFYIVEYGRGMAAPVFCHCFLYGRGREGHGSSSPSVIVFYMVVDGRGMAAPVLLLLFFIWSRTGGAWRLPSFCHCFLYGRGRVGHGVSRPSVIVFYIV